MGEGTEEQRGRWNFGQYVDTAPRALPRRWLELQSEMNNVKAAAFTAMKMRLFVGENGRVTD